MALVDDQRRWRGAHLLVGAMHLAEEIERRSRSRTVGVMLPTGGLFPMAALAGWMVGRTVVPLNYLLAADELQYVVDDCETDLVVTVGPMLEHVGFEPRCRSLLRLEEVRSRAFPSRVGPPGRGSRILRRCCIRAGRADVRRV